MTEQTPGTAEEVEAIATAERTKLLTEAGSLGLTGFRKNVSAAALEELIQRHKDAKKQADAILAEQAKISAAIPKNEVMCRVTKKGDQKLSKGIHIPGKGDLRYGWKDEVSIDRKAAHELEERGFVEIEDATA
ncbi:hypothetical protein UFOVP1333_6 [uncultured Caudovirales phage]|uniref:Uncharacterized protein n=1 Tax=uncultured Caudovirales phage TaxID=2100421 RepID=A0A6J5RXN3_9CAUD|nr:hypothetical protein UFOVP1333_6 [uncultured Caudovirales phage]